MEQVEQPVCPGLWCLFGFNNIVCENYVEEDDICPQWQEIYKAAPTLIESSFMHFGIGVKE